MTQEALPVPDENQGATSIGMPDQSTEKMLPQSKVDEIVKHVKYEAAEKARRDALSQMQAQQQPPQQQPNQVNSMNNNTGLGGMTPDALRNMVAEETQKHQQALMMQAQEQANREAGSKMAAEFYQKLESGSSKYDDYSDTVGTLPFSKIPHLVQLAHSMDNTDDIMYDIAKNPLKMPALEALASMDPNKAMQAVRQLSDSIKSNQQAKNASLPNEPMSQIKSSPNSTDNGSMTVSDYMKIFK